MYTRTSAKIRQGDIDIFSRQLATLIKSGIPLFQAFGIIAREQQHPGMKDLTEKLAKSLESGFTLAESLKKQDGLFSDLFCNLVATGEQSGTLEEMLNNLASYREKIHSLKRKIAKTLAYPAVVLAMALLTSLALLIFAVPRFETLFKGFGAELPAMTAAIITLSRFFQNFWYLIPLMICGAGFGIRSLKKSPEWKQYRDRILLKLPVLGGIFEKASLARFCRTLAITLKAGLPLADALKCVSSAAGNLVYARAIMTIRAAISTGYPLHLALKHTRIFPHRLVQMIAIGEESGTLEFMLEKLADFYEEAVDNAIEAGSNLLEPLLMSLLGILVGGLVLAMYLPVFKLGSVI